MFAGTPGIAQLVSVRTMARRICLGICLCVFAAASQLDAGGRALALYSWKPPGKTWHFVLIPDPFPKPVSRIEVTNTVSPIVGVDGLKARLAATSTTDWAIIWRDLPPERVVRYPPQRTRDEIIAFGRRHGLNIEIGPTLNE